jgi:hypothetical protein
MPRYYFRLTDGKRVLDNHKGIDLPGNAAARIDAVAFARDLKHAEVMRGWDWTGWFVAIIDQHGQRVEEVPIAIGFDCFGIRVDASVGEGRRRRIKNGLVERRTIARKKAARPGEHQRPECVDDDDR